MIEGSPEEVLAVAKGLEGGSHPSTPALETVAAEPISDAASTAKGDGGKKVFVSTNVARKVITRLPLSREQKIVLMTLAQNHPKGVNARALQKATGYSPQQFAGLMGAFGRRLVNTKGYVADTWFFDDAWNDATNAWDYMLPQTVIEAMKAEKLI
jgi:hypothetical protein